MQSGNHETKPEGYPHVRLRALRSGEWRPVLIDWHPSGYEQESEARDPDSWHEAHRDAAVWARSLKIPYRSE